MFIYFAHLCGPWTQCLHVPNGKIQSWYNKQIHSMQTSRYCMISFSSPTFTTWKVIDLKGQSMCFTHRLIIYRLDLIYQIIAFCIGNLTKFKGEISYKATHTLLAKLQYIFLFGKKKTALQSSTTLDKHWAKRCLDYVALATKKHWVKRSEVF